MILLFFSETGICDCSKRRFLRRKNWFFKNQNCKSSPEIGWSFIQLNHESCIGKLGVWPGQSFWFWKKTPPYRGHPSYNCTPASRWQNLIPEKIGSQESALKFGHKNGSKSRGHDLKVSCCCWFFQWNNYQLTLAWWKAPSKRGLGFQDAIIQQRPICIYPMGSMHISIHLTNV